VKPFCDREHDVFLESLVVAHRARIIATVPGIDCHDNVFKSRRCDFIRRTLSNGCGGTRDHCLGRFRQRLLAADRCDIKHDAKMVAGGGVQIGRLGLCCGAGFNHQPQVIPRTHTASQPFEQRIIAE